MKTFFVSWGPDDAPKAGQMGLLAFAETPEEAAKIALLSRKVEPANLTFFVAEITAGDTWTLKVKRVTPPSKESLN